MASIATQLKTIPSALSKENLVIICKECLVKIDPKDTRATMRTKIDDFSQSSSDNERKVRDLISKIKSAQKDRLNSQSKENIDTDEEMESETNQTQQKINTDISQPPLFDDPTQRNEETINHEPSEHITLTAVLYPVLLRPAKNLLSTPIYRTGYSLPLSC